MNLYAILTMATVLASIVGVEEVMTLAGQVLAADGRPELLVPIYSFVLVWFFVYCYPIARWTVCLERKLEIDMGAFHRNRAINRDSSFSVIG